MTVLVIMQMTHAYHRLGVSYVDKRIKLLTIQKCTSSLINHSHQKETYDN